MRALTNILLIVIISFLVISCGNDNNAGIQTATKIDSIGKTEETRLIENYKNINIDDVKYIWQKNLLWFFYQKVSE